MKATQYQRQIELLGTLNEWAKLGFSTEDLQARKPATLRVAEGNRRVAVVTKAVPGSGRYSFRMGNGHASMRAGHKLLAALVGGTHWAVRTVPGEVGFIATTSEQPKAVTLNITTEQAEPPGEQAKLPLPDMPMRPDPASDLAIVAEACVGILRDIIRDEIEDALSSTCVRDEIKQAVIDGYKAV